MTNLGPLQTIEPQMGAGQTLTPAHKTVVFLLTINTSLDFLVPDTDFSDFSILPEQ